MRLVRLDDRYVNPEHVVRVSTYLLQNGSSRTEVHLLGGSISTTMSADKVAALLADEVVGGPR